MNTTHHDLPDMSGVPRVAGRHPQRWLLGIITLIALAFFIHAFVTGQIEWRYVGRFLTAQAILRGFINTCLMTALAMGLGVALGLVAALMKVSSNPVARSIASGYIWLFRGTPVYLQLLLWFNLALIFPALGVPGLWQVPTVEVMTPFLAAWLGLGVCQGAYTAEVIRAGILSVDSGQIEAAQAMGMRRRAVMRHVVLPQTLRVIAPALGNEVISMLKNTSLAAVISYNEMLHTASMIYFVNNRVIETLMVCAIYYLGMVTLLSVVQALIEKRLGRSVRQPEGEAA